jgi:hypothetical protein
MARRPPSSLFAIGLALVLASCGGGAPPTQSQSWSGTTTSADVTYPLVIATTLAPTGAWVGTYTVMRAPPFTGAVDATISGSQLEGVLVVTDACRFTLTGSLAGDALTATFSPTACPGGVGGTWAATRVGAAVAATTIQSAPGSASFGAASFGAARFR